MVQGRWAVRGVLSVVWAQGGWALPGTREGEVRQAGLACGQQVLGGRSGQQTQVCRFWRNVSGGMASSEEEGQKEADSEG